MPACWVVWQNLIILTVADILLICIFAASVFHKPNRTLYLVAMILGIISLVSELVYFFAIFGAPLYKNPPGNDPDTARE